MEENKLPAPISAFEIQSKEAGNKLANMYEIIIIILKNLEYNDLLNCKRVCSLWREVSEEIMKSRIFIVKAKMEFSNWRKSVLHPEEIRPYLKLQGMDNVQLVSQYPDYIPSHFLRTTNNALPVSIDWIERNVYDCFMKGKFELFSVYNISIKCEVFIRAAIFPTVPGVEIHHFSYTPEEINQCLIHERLNITEKINVRENELKGVLWFYGNNRIISFPDFMWWSNSFASTSKYAMGGASIFCKIDLTRGIAFCGKRIKAASLNLYRMRAEDTDQFVEPKFSLQQIENLKRYNIDQKKCVGFLFSDFNHYMKNILSNFENIFPHIPILLHSCYWPSGTEYMPEVDDVRTERNLTSNEETRGMQCASLVLVWFD